MCGVAEETLKQTDLHGDSIILQVHQLLIYMTETHPLKQRIITLVEH